MESADGENDDREPDKPQEIGRESFVEDRKKQN
jgi:hypothetical protein